MKIAKNHDVIKKIKSVLKTNTYPYLTVTDDLQILKIINDFNISIEELVYCDEKKYKDDTKALLNELINKAKNVYEISSSTYDVIATKENHIGIMAIIELPKYNINYLKDKNFIFVLDKLEIPGNIGTIYRTLDSVKADGVILVDSISKPHNPKLLSASRGCNLIIPTIDTTYNTAITWLLDNGFTIYLGEPNLGLDYKSYDYSGKIAIVVGNERFGINSDWYNHNHQKVYIPMEGNQNSLNVGVAASILAYEAYMKKKV